MQSTHDFNETASDGMPCRYWFNYFNSLSHRYAERPALVAADRSEPLSYAGLVDMATRVAHELGVYGIGAGSRVLVCLPNASAAPILGIALAMLAACDIPVAHGATEQELLWIVRQAGAEFLISDRRLQAPGSSEYPAEAVAPVGLKMLDIRNLSALNSASMARRRPAAVPQALPGSAMDIADLPGKALPSSGTTGLPKVSVYTHRARALAHKLQCDLLPYRPADGERLVLVTPFSHGASLLAWAWWDAGGLVDLLPGMDAGVLAGRIEQGATALFAPPTVLYKLLDFYASSGGRDNGLRHGIKTLFTGTQRLDPKLYQRTSNLFGPVVRVTYGKSECINPICYSQPAQSHLCAAPDHEQKGSCVGQPAAGVEIKILPDDSEQADSAELPAGRAGTVWLRARHMSLGTWQQGRLVPWDGGWHNTSDRGVLDEQGRLWLLGRKGDAVKSGGYLVQLESVEAIAKEAWPHLDCCALPWPSSYWGSIIVLAVARGDAGSSIPMPGPEQIKQAFARHARQMKPRLVLPLPSLPRNAQGKMKRQAALEALRRRYALVDGAYPQAQPLKDNTLDLQ